MRKRLFKRMKISALNSSVTKQIIIKSFHHLYFQEFCTGKLKESTFWFGHMVEKCPFDLWVYQEILFQLKPQLVIETGTAGGGTTCFLASILDLIGEGMVVSVDIKDQRDMPRHDRIRYISGSSISDDVFSQVKQICSCHQRIMVILDSNHRKDHVLRELELYSSLVSVQSYLIVEDSDLNGHPVGSSFGPGPWEAVEEFLEKNKDFVIDKDRERFMISFNPNGYLKKIKDTKPI